MKIISAQRLPKKAGFVFFLIQFKASLNLVHRKFLRQNLCYHKTFHYKRLFKCNSISVILLKCTELLTANHIMHFMCLIQHWTVGIYIIHFGDITESNSLYHPKAKAAVNVESTMHICDKANYLGKLGNSVVV